MVTARDIITNYPVAIIIVLLICCLAFVILGHYYPAQLQGVLKHSIIDVPPVTLDYWSLSHFMLFGVIGFLMPGHIWEWGLVGVLWELIEDYLASDDSTQLASCKYPLQPNGKRKAWCNGPKGSYWYGKWDDVVVNICGYVVGSQTRAHLIHW